MPLRGENIGTAYVRIIADGDGLDESIRRQFDESEPGVREAGRKHGETYEEEFRKQYRKSFEGNFEKKQRDLFDDANRSLTESLARLKLSENFFNNPEWHKFRTRLSNEFGDAGSLAGQRLEEKFRDSTNLESLAAEMKNIGPQVRRAQADLLDHLTADRLKQEKDGQALSLKLERDHLAEALQLNKQFDAQRTKIDRDRLTEAYQMNKQFDERSFKARLDLDREFMANHHRAFQAAQQEEEQSQTARWRREHSRLALLVKDIDRAGDAGGAAFGRGSRNNFLNFVGSVVRNLIRSLSLIPRIIAPIGDAFAFIKKGFQDAAVEGEGFFSNMMRGAVGAGGALAEIVATGLPGLVALAAAATLAVSVIGPLVAIASGLLAGLTALASAVTFGLVGALAPLVGLLPVVAFGIGALATAFIGLKKEGLKDLKETIKPITDGLKDLGNEVRKGLFSRITEDAKGLGTMFKGLEPLFHGIGRAVADTVHMMLAEFNGPGGKAFVRDMTTFIPAAIRDLGEVFVHTLGGFGGIFRSLIPVTQTFLEWMEKITFHFANWANSTRGQNSLKKFFDDAWKSAKDLGGLLKETGGLIADLFSAGRGQGNSMLTDMTAQIHDLRNFLAAHPGALKDWFNNGLDTMRAVGGLIRDISKAIGELDTPENRFVAQAMFKALSLTVDLAAQSIHMLLLPLEIGVAAIDGMRNAIGWLIDGWAAFLDVSALGMDALSHVPGFQWAKRGADNLRDAADQARGLADNIKGIPDPKVDTEAASADIGALRNQVDGFANKPFTIRALADVSDAHRDFGALRDDLNLIPKKPLIFSVIANIRSVKVAQDNTRQLMNQLTGVDEYRARTSVEVDTKRAHNNVRQLLDDLHDVKPKTVDANVRTAQGHKNMRELMNDIDHFHGKSVDVNVRTAQAHSNMRQLIDDVGQLHDRTVTITTRNVKVGSTSGKSANPTNNAAGGVFPAIPQLGHLIRIAEVAGQPEAVVPLNRPLSQVDPSVRLLSAIAQGKVPGMASGGVVPAPSGRTVNIDQLHLHSPTENPKAAANEFLNALVATSY